jgi:uncharacterized protein YgiM (DUF1202 family)
MQLNSALTRLLMLSLLLCLVWSCVQPPVQPLEITYYVNPEVTYLLENPVYGSNVIGPVFRGDKVERVGGDSDWLQVTLARSGQTGWIRKELLRSSPVSTRFYYVKEDSQPLLECPRSDCLPVQLLFRGDGVQKIEEGTQGWWKILVIQSHNLGWVPAATLTNRIEEAQQQQPKKQYYYVAVTRLSLRAKPSAREKGFRTLRFNDQVEKIHEAPDWFKVRHPSSGAIGWVWSGSLKSLPAIYPRGRVAPASEKQEKQEELRPFKQKEAPESEPEFM